jgi:hypothetical protein
MSLIYAIGVCVVISLPSSSALFVFRVTAVYYRNDFIAVFFGCLWLGLLGLTFLIPLAVRGGHIGITQRCLITQVASYASAPLVLNCVIDTLIFIVISVRIMSFSYTDGPIMKQVSTFFRGDGLPRFSRNLLRNGQLYYLFVASSSLLLVLPHFFFLSATITLNIIVVVMVFAPVPPVFHTLFGVPNVALESAMACRVFRQLRTDLVTDSDLVTSPQFSQQSHPLVVLSPRNRSFGVCSLEDTSSNPVHVEMEFRECHGSSDDISDSKSGMKSEVEKS